jgi:transcriptional regulator GlxA family with amidase domain
MQPVKISIVVHEDVVLSAVASVIDMLEVTNHIHQSSGRPAAFAVELVSNTIRNIQLDIPVQFICQKTLSQIRHTDLVIVPSFKPDYKVVLKKNRAIIRWLSEMHSAGAEVASLCVGSFFLAEAGLLNGKEATSHWMATDEMQTCYPLIKVKPDKIITDQNGIYTSGGAFNSLKLILYLIEKFCSKETAIQVAKRMSVDFENFNQGYFSVFNGLRNHGDKEILQSQNFIEQHFARNIKVEIAALTTTGKRNFLRRFKMATNNTPMEYLQRVKIEAAKRILEDGEQTIQGAMVCTGYKDVKTFRMIFKRITGLSPRDYRYKYSRN